MSVELTIRFNSVNRLPVVADPRTAPAYLNTADFFDRFPDYVSTKLMKAGIKGDDAKKIERFLIDRYEENSQKALCTKTDLTISKSDSSLPYSFVFDPSGEVYIKAHFLQFVKGTLKIKKLAISAFSGIRYIRLVAHIDNPDIKPEKVIEYMTNEASILQSLKGIKSIVQIQKISRGMTKKGKDRFSLYEQECPQGDLFDNLQKLNDSERLHIADCLIQGVKELHSRNIVHRDLKPENIYLHGKALKEAVIGDFNLALYLPLENATPDISGTLEYFSPEKAHCYLVQNFPNGRQERQSDIWALGFIFLDLFFPTCAFGPEYNAMYVNWNHSSKEKKLRFLKNLANPHRFEQNQQKFLSKPCATKKLSNLVHGMLQIDPNKRSTIDQVADQWKKIYA